MWFINSPGSWDPGRWFKLAFGNTVSFSNDRTAEIRLEFEGSSFTYGFSRAPNRGRAQIFMDGKAAGVLDQYCPSVEWQSEQRFSAERRSIHQVTIRVTGGKTPVSEGAFVDLNFLVIDP